MYIIIVVPFNEATVFITAGCENLNSLLDTSSIPSSLEKFHIWQIYKVISCFRREACSSLAITIEGHIAPQSVSLRQLILNSNIRLVTRRRLAG